MFDDISFLVQETLKNTEMGTNNKSVLSNLFNFEDDMPEEVPGILYHLQKKSSTFVIRIHPCENLKEDYQNVLKHPDMFPALRLNESEAQAGEVLEFFECDRYEVAQNIKQTLGNKRFPTNEEHIFNVSDPGDSWWVKAEESKLTVMFKLSRTEDMDSLVKMGPIGDPVKAMEVLSQLYGYFKMIFPVSDYSCGHGQWTIKTSDENNANFKYLKELFIEGETSYDFWEYLRNLEFKSDGKPYLDSLRRANYFLMELACIREFWKLIESKL